ncbi:uncharacterized protein DS421_1g18000 [Arachis hypogaea]|nr:uncharacterized protein DS421_1g18000 [Arachis hypogaea]
MKPRICLQLDLVSNEDNVEVEMADWEVKNLKFTVKQLIEVVLTSDKAQHLTFLWKSEVDSMGRIEVKVLTRISLLSTAEMIMSSIEDLSVTEAGKQKLAQIDDETDINFARGRSCRFTGKDQCLNQ